MRSFNQTAADRKVAAEFVHKQHGKVMAGIEEIIKLKRHSHILDKLWRLRIVWPAAILPSRTRQVLPEMEGFAAFLRR